MRFDRVQEMNWIFWVHKYLYVGDKIEILSNLKFVRSVLKLKVTLSSDKIGILVAVHVITKENVLQNNLHAKKRTFLVRQNVILN